MKIKNLLFTTISIILLCILSIQIGCKKDDNEPDPAQKKYIWAVGFADNTNYATLLFSGDGGDAWIRQGGDNEALKGVDLHDVWAIDENTVWAIGTNNTIVKTSDAGLNWNKIPAPAQQAATTLSSISIHGASNIWISGGDSTTAVVYHSNDAGDSWTNIQSPLIENAYLQGICAITENIVYAAGGIRGKSSNGFIVKTTDGGQTWDSISPINNFNKHIWIGVSSPDPNNIVIYGGNGYYMASTNGGQSWRNDSVPVPGGGGLGADLNCLKMLDSQTWWGAFDLDNIYRTGDGGTNWTSQGPAPNPGNMWLLGIDYYSEYEAVIVGSSESSNKGKIIRTADGGQLWILAHETEAWMQKVSFIKK